VLAVPADDPVASQTGSSAARGSVVSTTARPHRQRAQHPVSDRIRPTARPCHRRHVLAPPTLSTTTPPKRRWRCSRCGRSTRPATAAILPTINDLALGPDRRIYALSAHAPIRETLRTPGDRWLDGTLL